MDALRLYKELEYGNINSALSSHRKLSDIPQPYRGYIEEIDRKMVSGDQPIRLYRAMAGVESLIRNYGSIVHRNFASSTKSLKVAHKFTADKCCILSFLLHPSIKRHDYMDEKHEEEVLIQRGVEFRVRPGFYMIGGYPIYEAEVLLYTEPAPLPPMAIDPVEEHALDIMGIASEIVEELEFVTRRNRLSTGKEIDEAIAEHKEREEVDLDESIIAEIKRHIIEMEKEAVTRKSA